MSDPSQHETLIQRWIKLGPRWPNINLTLGQRIMFTGLKCVLQYWEIWIHGIICPLEDHVYVFFCEIVSPLVQGGKLSDNGIAHRMHWSAARVGKYNLSFVF